MQDEKKSEDMNENQDCTEEIKLSLRKRVAEKLSQGICLDGFFFAGSQARKELKENEAF